MATTTKSLTARVAAGLGAAALATLTVLGGALPASAAANIDPAEPASITIHKHEQPATPGQPGTGSANDPVAGDAMPGVEFSIQQVTSLDVAESGTWLALDALDADDVLADSTAYPLGTVQGTDAWTVTTGADGTIAQAVPQGVYLVTELSAPVAAGVVLPAEPFLVVVPQATADGAWNYDVHVFPKNTVTDALKTVSAFDQQGLGSAITWTIDVGVPIATDGAAITSFAIQDALDARLEHDLADADALAVSVGGTALARGTDYTATIDAGVLSVDLTASGLAALVANPGERVALVVTTTVVGVGDGSIENQATVVVNGAASGPSIAASGAAGVLSNVATDHWGGIELLKTDDHEQPLAGAVFQVLDADRQVVAVDGQTEFVSGADGRVVIAGLRTNETGTASYTVVETEAPAGYRLGTTTEWAVTVPVGVTAALELDPIVNEQVPPYALPVTGGSGQAAFMIGGAGLLLGALGFMLVRRRRGHADA